MSLKMFFLMHQKKIIILITLLCSIIPGCREVGEKIKDGNVPVLHQSRLMMGTIVEVSIQHSNKELSNQAMKKAFEEIDRIESLMSLYKDDSELSLINRQAYGGAAKISEEMLELLQISRNAWQLTSGGFDPTASPIIQLWGFYKNQGYTPEPEKIEEKLKLVDLQKIEVDEEKMEIRFLSRGIKLDFNAIAKGYAVDRAVKALKAEGINRALINAGGDIYALGGKVNQGYWNIGIKHPMETNKILASIKLNDKAIVTSGNYEKFFTIDGKQYCHIINPKTGYPVQGMLSVTIEADSVAMADALATGIFVLGKEKGLNLLNNLENVEGIIIVKDLREPSGMKIFTSDNLSKKMKFLNK